MSKKAIDDTLAEEIGPLGAEEAQGLGKLKHKSAYGQKEDLNAEEEASLNAFLSKGRQIREQKEAEDAIIHGFLK